MMTTTNDDERRRTTPPPHLENQLDDEQPGVRTGSARRKAILLPLMPRRVARLSTAPEMSAQTARKLRAEGGGVRGYRIGEWYSTGG